MQLPDELAADEIDKPKSTPFHLRKSENCDEIDVLKRKFDTRTIEIHILKRKMCFGAT